MEIIYDIKKHTFKASGFDDSTFRDRNICVGFTEGGDLPVEFSDLNFSIEVSSQGESLLNQTFPPTGFTIDSTDQEFVNQYHVCNLVPEQDYLVKLSVTNDGHTENFEGTFNIGAVKALYPSWIWSDEANDWVPPVPEPSEGDYYWEESLQQWIPIEDMIKRMSED